MCKEYIFFTQFQYSCNSISVERLAMQASAREVAIYHVGTNNNCYHRRLYGFHESIQIPGTQP